MFVAKCSDKIIVLSKLGKENLAKILSPLTMQRKVIYVHLGTYPSSIAMKKSGLLRSRYAVKQSESIFTLFGFAFPQKGYEFAVQAMDVLVNQQKQVDVRLVIVSGDNTGAGLPGGGQGLSYIGYLRKLTTQYHLDDKVIFTGYLASNDPLLEDIFDDTYCFLFPYRNRHFPSGAISTVLATHKPILVSNIRSFEEYEGLEFFAREDASALADKMMDILDNPQKMTEMAAVSRYNAEKFSMDKAFLRHVEIYRELSRKLVK
jgi:glycosyltransferase involved in cell wall biosynthesis